MKKLFILSLLALLFLCSCARAGDGAYTPEVSQKNQEESFAAPAQTEGSGTASAQNTRKDEGSPLPSSFVPAEGREPDTLPATLPPGGASTETPPEQTRPSQEVQTPGAPPAEPSETPTSETAVIMNIICLEDVILDTAAFEPQPGDTAFDLLKRVTRERNIPLDFSGSGAGVYIKGINNIYEYDMGAESGWMYRVNGVFPGMGCGAYALSSGDVIEWMYTKNMGKDLDADFD